MKEDKKKKFEDISKLELLEEELKVFIIIYLIFNRKN